MYFTEPQRTAFDFNFSLLGVPVRVSPWFWLGTAIFGYGMTGHDFKQLLLWEVAVFLSILVHEMGHAIAIRSLGESPWVTLVFLGGLAGSSGGRRSPRDQILVSAMGPVAQILFAFLVIALVRASGHAFSYPIPFWPDSWYDLNGLDNPRLQSETLSRFTLYMVWPSIVWAVLNLVPVFPLDGGQIARAAFAIFNPREGLKQSLVVSVAAGAIVAVYGFKIQQPYMGMMFAALAFDSYQTLQSFGGRTGGWR